MRIFLLILLLLSGSFGLAWAKTGHFKNISKHKTEMKNDPDDDEMDDGEGDEKTDEPSDNGKFKQDPDDTYEVPSAGKDDVEKSKFKEDEDEDDQETDDSDQD